MEWLGRTVGRARLERAGAPERPPTGSQRSLRRAESSSTRRSRVASRGSWTLSPARESWRCAGRSCTSRSRWRLVGCQRAASRPTAQRRGLLRQASSATRRGLGSAHLAHAAAEPGVVVAAVIVPSTLTIDGRALVVPALPAGARVGGDHVAPPCTRDKTPSRKKFLGSIWVFNGGR